MADLEAVLADVSYLMAMEKSKSTPAARASKKIILPDPRYVEKACPARRWPVSSSQSCCHLHQHLIIISTVYQVKQYTLIDAAVKSLPLCP